jgi:hypothetical protein
VAISSKSILGLFLYVYRHQLNAVYVKFVLSSVFYDFLRIAVTIIPSSNYVSLYFRAKQEEKQKQAPTHIQPMKPRGVAMSIKKKTSTCISRLMLFFRKKKRLLSLHPPGTGHIQQHT